MKKSITYHEFEKTAFNDLLNMAGKLWSDIKREPLAEILSETTVSEKYKVILALTSEGHTIGFSIFSIRTDPVEGAYQSPTGYLEGIFVEENFRKLGVASGFLEIGENWCRKKGCTQMGSDTWIDDADSRAFHKKVGFWEEEEVVHFLKNL